MKRDYRNNINTTLLLLRGVLLLDDSNPMRILKTLKEVYPNSMNVTEIYIKTRVAQSNVSSLLRELEKLGLVRKVKKGKEVYCTLKEKEYRKLEESVANPLKEWVEEKLKS